jgi:fatty acid desaturase
VEDFMNPNDLQPPRDRGPFLGMMLTVLAVGFFVLVLIFITGGFFLYVVQITAGIFLVALFHYVVWGRAMSQAVAGEREEEQLRQRAAAEADGEDWPAEHPHGIRRP